MLELERDLNDKKTILNRAEEQHQVLINSEAESIVLLEKLSKDINDLKHKIQNEEFEYDDKVAAAKRQLTINEEENDRMLQTIVRMKETREKTVAKSEHRIKKKTEKIAQFEQKKEKVKNANSTKKEEVEVKTRLSIKLQDELARLNTEVTPFTSPQRPILKPTHCKTTSSPAGILKKTENVVKLPFTPKKVTFPDLSSQSSDGTSVPAISVCKSPFFGSYSLYEIFTHFKRNDCCFVCVRRLMFVGRNGRPLIKMNRVTAK